MLTLGGVECSLLVFAWLLEGEGKDVWNEHNHVAWMLEGEGNDVWNEHNHVAWMLEGEGKDAWNEHNPLVHHAHVQARCNAFFP